MSSKISLKQFLMKSGRFERVYDCVQFIRDGKVSINNKIITNPNYFFSLKNPLVKVDNEKAKRVAKLYFLLNKPAGYLSQKSAGEKTIYDLLESLNLAKESKNSLYAVGRLDKDTEGLMIITNDGRMSDIIMHPENELIKKYYAMLEKTIDINKIKILEKGIEITIDEQILKIARTKSSTSANNKSAIFDDAQKHASRLKKWRVFDKYKTKPCRIKVVGEKEIYISISEGKKRQIRLMLEAIGNKVAYLKRVSIGGLQLGKLKIGEIMSITKEEIMEKLEI